MIIDRLVRRPLVRPIAAALSVATLVSLSARAEAAELLPCDGTEIELGRDGAELDEASFTSVFPDGVLGKGTSFGADVGGEVRASSDAGWFWLDAYGGVDLAEGGSWRACVDDANDRVTLSWLDVPSKGDASDARNSFQIVMRPEVRCVGGAEVELRVKSLEWPILVELSSPSGLESFGFGTDHAAGSNIEEPGVYVAMSCRVRCPEGMIADGEVCNLVDHGGAGGGSGEGGGAGEGGADEGDSSGAGIGPGDGHPLIEVRGNQLFTAADRTLRVQKNPRATAPTSDDDALGEASQAMAAPGDAAGCSTSPGVPSGAPAVLALITFALARLTRPGQRSVNRRG